MENRNNYVTEVRAADVLFGRGSGPNDHEGNIRFRSLVAERKEEYMATNHRMTKAKIAKEIVDKVFNVDGRFLKKVEATELKELGMPEGSEVYEIVGDDTIMEKAKQALRQNTQKSKSKDPESKSKSPTPHRETVNPGVPDNRMHHHGHHNHLPPPLTTSRLMDGHPGELEPLPVSPASFGSETPGFSPLASQATRMAGGPAGNGYMGWNQPSFARGVPKMNSNNQLMHPHPYHYDMTSSRQPHPSDSMLAYVRRYDQQAAAHHHDASNLSMAQIPQDDVVGVPPRRLAGLDRQTSMNMAELSRARQGQSNTMEMSELMDSFSKMKTGGEDSRKMHASVETMGTIEHINPGSIADMSLGTIGSSTFSLFRGNESLAAMDDKLLETTERNQPPTPDNLREAYRDHASMSLSEVWTSRRKNGPTSNVTLTSSSGGGSSDISKLSRDSLRSSLSCQSKSSNKVVEAPPSKFVEDVSGLDVDNMGASSLSVLKAAYHLNDEENRNVAKKTFYVGDHAQKQEK